MSEEVQDGAASPQAGGSEDRSGSVIDRNRRKPLMLGLAAAVVVIGVLWVGYEMLFASRYVSTDNAYVSGESSQVIPLTSGQVIDVAVTDTQPVRKGQLLFRLDDADQKIALAQAEAGLAYAQRRYGQSLANNRALGAAADASSAEIATAQARLTSASADAGRAQAEYDRRARLAGSGAVSAEEVATARQALTAAKAALSEAKAGLEQARSNANSARRQEEAAVALTQGTNVETAPEILLAKSRLATAKLDLERTIVRAPISGVVAQRRIQVGQRIDANSTAMIIVPVGKLYVDANFKENELGKVRSGQEVTLTSDFYGGDVVFHGKVAGFAGGTGSAFSLIPAQNATGNWIKVVQRLPVRVELDPKELAEHPLRIGLSMEAEIDLSSKR